MTDAKEPKSHDGNMRLRQTFMLSAAIILLFLSPIFVAVQPLASAVAEHGSFVVLLRHGDAPGRGEPDGFDLNDCSTQRNLSAKGRDAARDLGEQIRARGIKVGKILASRWCRARETAELMELGPIESSAAFDDLALNKNRAQELLDSERKIISSWSGPGILLIVGHGSNIKALTGVDLGQGAMVVVKPEQGRLEATPFAIGNSFANQFHE
jgi:phosphohistidine phosphatase SixA